MKLFSAVRRWKVAQSERQAIHQLGTGGGQSLAQDLGLSESSLDALVSSGADAAAELPRLLTQVSLDPEQLKATNPSVMRDMQIVCSTCIEKSCCREDLDLQVSAATFDEYCLNEHTISALLQEKSS